MPDRLKTVAKNTKLVKSTNRYYFDAFLILLNYHNMAGETPVVNLQLGQPQGQIQGPEQPVMATIPPVRLMIQSPATGTAVPPTTTTPLEQTQDVLTGPQQQQEIDPKDIRLETYSDKSFVARGEGTRLYQGQLIHFGGTWNSRLRGGGGYIFSNRHLDDVTKWMAQVQAGTVKPDSADAIRQAKEEKKVARGIKGGYTAGTIGGKMQLVQWRVFIPRVGQRAQLRVAKATADYVVGKIEEHDGIFDTVFIHPDGQPEKESKLVICNGHWQVWGYDNEHTIFFQ